MLLASRRPEVNFEEEKLGSNADERELYRIFSSLRVYNVNNANRL